MHNYKPSICDSPSLPKLRAHSVGRSNSNSDCNNNRSDSISNSSGNDNSFNSHNSNVCTCARACSLTCVRACLRACLLAYLPAGVGMCLCRACEAKEAEATTTNREVDTSCKQKLQTNTDSEKQTGTIHNQQTQNSAWTQHTRGNKANTTHKHNTSCIKLAVAATLRQKADSTRYSQAPPTLVLTGP